MDTPTGLLQNAYDTDTHAWLLMQAERLRARSASELDWDNLAEEIESLGASERRELMSRLETIMEHLLKIEFGKDRRPVDGWKRTVDRERLNIERHLEQSPSLHGHAYQFARQGFGRARRAALLSFATHEAERLDWYEAALPPSLVYSLEMLLKVGDFPE